MQDEKAVSDRIAHRMLDISGKMLEKKLSYLLLFTPELYAANREEAFIQISLIPEQIGWKLALISEEIHRKFDLPPGPISGENLTALTPKRRDEVTYGLSFLFLVRIVEVCERDIDHAIRCAAPEAFAVLSELEGQLQRQEESVQYYVDQLKQSRLDEMTSVEYLETAADHLQSMASRLVTLGCDQRSRMEKLKDVLEVFLAGSRVVNAVASGLKNGMCVKLLDEIVRTKNTS